jgi:hypothetical protein
MVIHPPSGGHSGVSDGVNVLYPCAVRVDLKGLLDLDFIYFDPKRDVELAKVINEFNDYESNDIPVMIWMQKAKPSLAWEWSDDNLFRPNPEIPIPEIPGYKMRP